MQIFRCVESDVLHRIPYASLMQRTKRTGQQTGRHHNQKRARPTEKLRQVQAHTALINQRTDNNRRQQPQYRTYRHRPRRALLEHGKQEKHAFQTFARHGQKRHADQGPALAAAVVQGRLNRILKMLFHRTRGLLHPQNHVRQHRHGHQADDADHQFLFFLRNLTRNGMNAVTDTQTHGRSQKHAQPNLRHQLAVSRLFQKTGNNADDQGGFDALAQHNQ